MGFRTQREVDRLALPTGKADAYFFDEGCRGLSVRIQGTRRTWVVHYTVDGRRRRIGLGDVSSLQLRDAQKQAGAIVSAGKDGADPLAKRQERAGRRADTFGGLVDLYIARYAESHQRPRTLVETRRALKVHLAPLHDLPVDALARRSVAGRLLELVETSGPIMANRTRAALSHCYAWAMEQGLADLNPVVGTARPAPEVRRDRVLSADELRAVWLACTDDTHGRIVKLLILTGQRCREIGGMGWCEIDRDKGLFTLPATRSKNGRQHEVPLSAAALALVGEPRKDRRGSSVFGRGESGFAGWSKAKRRLDTACRVAGWTLHDLRRTAVTGMAEIGIAPHVIEAIVNHVSGHKAGVAGVYNHAKYSQEKRTALQRWADHVETLVSAEARENVIAFGGVAR